MTPGTFLAPKIKARSHYNQMQRVDFGDHCNCLPLVSGFAQPPVKWSPPTDLLHRLTLLLGECWVNQGRRYDIDTGTVWALPH